MSLWIVQRLDGNTRGRFGDLLFQWTDIPTEHGKQFWEADTAGEAFRDAVLGNESVQLSSVSYRVLPFDGGVTFNVDVNVAVEEHA